MKTIVTLGSVEFTNFPGYRDESGEITWSLMESVVAERYANRFEDQDREVISVDWDKVPAEEKRRIREQAKTDLGICNPFSTEEAARDAEHRLYEQLVEMGMFAQEA